MTVIHHGNQRYTGLAGDTKPTNAPANAEFWETDTGKVWVYNGSAWVARSLRGSAKYVVFKDGATTYCIDENGKTVSSSTTVATPIQYALDNLTTSRTWKDIVKLRGDFQFPQITLNSFTTLDLTEAQLTQSNGTNANFISNTDQTNGNNNIEIVGGVIDGNKSGQSAGGTEDSQSMIFFKKCSAVSIHDTLVKNGDFHNVRFRDCPSHIEFCNNRSLDPRHEHIACHAQGTTQASCHDYVIANNRFENISEGQSYITTINVANVVVANNVCRGMFGNTSAFALNGLRQIVVGNSIMTTDGPGINLGQLSGTDYDTSGSIVMGNNIKTVQRYAIESQGMVCSNLVVANNIVDGVSESGHRGIYMLGLLDSIIANNIIKNIASSGIAIRGNNAVSLPTKRVKVIGNQVYNCGQTQDVSDVNRAGITIFGDASGSAVEIEVLDNKCYDIQGTKTQKWGIRLSIVDDCIVKNNDVRGNLTAGMQITTNTNGVVSNNIGWATEAFGATSVADGGTISHGLSSTPTTVIVTPRTSGEFASVTARSTTTFTVALKKHDNTAGTTQTVDWRAYV